MKKLGIFWVVFFMLFNVNFVFSQDSGEPGSYDFVAPEGMSDVLELDARLNPSEDEFVVYYYRPDKKYREWGLYIEAYPRQNGNAIWPYTQNWTVDDDGVAYIRLKLDGSTTGGEKFFSDAGTCKMIVRKKAVWDDDGGNKRIWELKRFNRVAIFSKNSQTYAATDYKPIYNSAEFVSEKEIRLNISGRFGLDTNRGVSGFSITDSAGTDYRISEVYNTNFPNNPEKNLTADITIKLVENANAFDVFTVKNPAIFDEISIDSKNLAVKIASERMPDSSTTLGYVLKNGSAEFRLWAPTSASVTLNIYKEWNAKDPDYTSEMKMDPITGVWSTVFSAEDPDGLFYDYTVKNSKGTMTVLDPYALSMAAFTGEGTGRGAIVNLSSEKAGYQSEPYVQLAKRDDAIIYEMSVRDFTISPDANVENTPGTYKAFIEKIPYLQELGITHLQLMPVVNFYYNDETNQKYEDSGTVRGNNYNWGYDPHQYFTPEGWYASDAYDPYCRIRELRELINECHKAGIGVLLDVVYNHMATTQLLDDIVPGYFFRLNENGEYTSASGCGNDTASENAMMKRLIVDSTVHWVANYKVDGFRFDLMGLIESSVIESAYSACAKLNKSVLFEGEGWKMYNGREGTVGMDQNYMLKTNNVACFNDEYRDLMKAGGFNETSRGLITKKRTDSTRFFKCVTGNPDYNFRVNSPASTLNYLVCHDGLTLHDAIVNNLQLDETKDRKEIISRLKLGNFILLTSQGIAFLHGGQERGRTKPNIKGVREESIGAFVRNSYDSADNINQFVWEIDNDYQGLLDYTKELIAIRKGYTAFRLGTAKAVAKNVKDLELYDSNGLVFGYVLTGKKDKWVAIINANSEQKEINITGVSLKNAVIYIDSEVANRNGIPASDVKGVVIAGSTVTLDPLTATLIRIK